MEVQGLIQSNLSFRVLPSYVAGLLYIRDFLKLSLTPMYHGYDILERTNCLSVWSHWKGPFRVLIHGNAQMKYLKV